ncbi:MAG: HK97 family phage prohead protease [Proteobacteria bacterium]|nr:HK97 family phage prohead protease [Pseudomonadota bacterium]
MTIIQHVRPRLARTNTPVRLAALGPDGFEGYASLFRVADGAGDIVVPGAFERSLRRRPPDRVRLLYQHDANEPIGVWEEIREDARGLYVRGRFALEVEKARDVRELVAAGALDGLSIGFRAVRARRGNGTRTLLEIELWEISIVTFPLLEGSAVTAIGTKSTIQGEHAWNTKPKPRRPRSATLSTTSFPPSSSSRRPMMSG